MGLLPDTRNRGLCMRRECRERFPRHRLQRKPLVSDPSMHHGTCVTHVPWCMSESPTRGGGRNVPGIPGACATHNFTYLARGPCDKIVNVCVWYHNQGQNTSLRTTSRACTPNGFASRRNVSAYKQGKCYGSNLFNALVNKTNTHALRNDNLARGEGDYRQQLTIIFISFFVFVFYWDVYATIWTYQLQVKIAT